MGNDPPLHSVVSEICTDWKYFTVRFKLSNYGLTVLFTIQGLVTLVKNLYLVSDV